MPLDKTTNPSEAQSQLNAIQRLCDKYQFHKISHIVQQQSEPVGVQNHPLEIKQNKCIQVSFCRQSYHFSRTNFNKNW